MATAYSLLIEISANIARLQKDMEAAKVHVSKFAQSSKEIEKSFQSSIASINKSFLAFGAAATGVFYTLKEGWEVAKEAASFQDQKAQLNSMADAYGTTANSMISSIEKMSDGLISMKDIVSVSSEAMLKSMQPDQLIQLAKYADALGDSLGITAAEGFRRLAEAAALGRERTIENVIGLVDLKEKYGEAAEKMSDTEKQSARLAIMMERLAQKFPEAGREVDSVSDKMERLEIRLENLRLEAGALAIRGGTALIGVANSIAYAWTETAKSLTAPFVIIEKGLNEIGMAGTFWQDTFAEQNRLTKEFAKGAKDNFKLMTTSADKLFKMMKGSKIGEEFKNNLLEMNKALEQFADKVYAMDPALTETSKEIEKLTDEFEKLRTEFLSKGWDVSFLDQLYYKGVEFIKQKTTMTFKDMVTDWEIARKKGIEKDLVEVDKWLSEMRKKYKDNIEYLEAIQEEAAKRRHDIELKYEQETISARIDILKQYRDIIGRFYDYAIGKAKEYLDAAKSIRELSNEIKSYLTSLVPGLPMTDFEKMKKQQEDISKAIQQSYQASYISDTQEWAKKAFELGKAFIEQWRGKKDWLGFDIDTGNVRDELRKLANYLDMVDVNTEKMGQMWESSASRAQSSIYQIDQQLYDLQIRLLNLQMELKVDTAIQAAIWAKEQIDAIIPDVMTKKIIIQTMYSGAPSYGPAGGEGGYQHGTDYVPRTGYYLLHEGEKVTPSYRNQNISFSPTIHVSGEGRSGKNIAKEIDKELARLFKYDRSELKKAMK